MEHGEGKGTNDGGNGVRSRPMVVSRPHVSVPHICVLRPCFLSPLSQTHGLMHMEFVLYTKQYVQILLLFSTETCTCISQDNSNLTQYFYIGSCISCLRFCNSKRNVSSVNFKRRNSS